jgi:hypothetical protein
MYKNSGPTVQKTHRSSLQISAYSLVKRRDTSSNNILWGTVFLNIKAGGTHSYHCAVNW